MDFPLPFPNLERILKEYLRDKFWKTMERSQSDVVLSNPKAGPDERLEALLYFLGNRSSDERHLDWLDIFNLISRAANMLRLGAKAGLVPPSQTYGAEEVLFIAELAMLSRDDFPGYVVDWSHLEKINQIEFDSTLSVANLQTALKNRNLASTFWIELTGRASAATPDYFSRSIGFLISEMAPLTIPPNDRLAFLQRLKPKASDGYEQTLMYELVRSEIPLAGYYIISPQVIGNSLRFVGGIAAAPVEEPAASLIELYQEAADRDRKKRSDANKLAVSLGVRLLACASLCPAETDNSFPFPSLLNLPGRRFVFKLAALPEEIVLHEKI